MRLYKKFLWAFTIIVTIISIMVAISIGNSINAARRNEPIVTTFNITNNSRNIIETIEVSCDFGELDSSRKSTNLSPGAEISIKITSPRGIDMGCGVTGNFDNGKKIQRVGDYVISSPYSIYIESEHLTIMQTPFDSEHRIENGKLTITKKPYSTY